MVRNVYVTPEVHEVLEAVLSERIAADQEASALIFQSRAVSPEHLCLHVHQPLFEWQYALACCPEKGRMHESALFQ